MPVIGAVRLGLYLRCRTSEDAHPRENRKPAKQPFASSFLGLQARTTIVTATKPDLLNLAPPSSRPEPVSPHRDTIPIWAISTLSRSTNRYLQPSRLNQVVCRKFQQPLCLDIVF